MLFIPFMEVYVGDPSPLISKSHPLGQDGGPLKCPKSSGSAMAGKHCPGDCLMNQTERGIGWIF